MKAKSLIKTALYLPRRFAFANGRLAESFESAIAKGLYGE